MRAVLLDLDDTLMATVEAKWEQHKVVGAKAFNMEITDDMLRAQWGKPLRTLLKALYDGVADEDKVFEVYESSAHLYPKRAITGALAAVQRLVGNGIDVGVVTSTLHSHAERDLSDNNFDLGAFFLVQGEDDLPAHKPDPAVFEPALQLLSDKGVDRSEVTYVGDSLVDFNAASAARIKFIGVATGVLSEAELAAAGVRHHAPDVTGAVDIVLRAQSPIAQGS